MRIKAKGRLREQATSGRRYHLEDGDEITVDPADEGDATLWVQRGWVKNLDTGEEVDPDLRPKKLTIN